MQKNAKNINLNNLIPITPIKNYEPKNILKLNNRKVTYLDELYSDNFMTDYFSNISARVPVLPEI